MFFISYLGSEAISVHPHSVDGVHLEVVGGNIVESKASDDGKRSWC